MVVVLNIHEHETRATTRTMVTTSTTECYHFFEDTKKNKCFPWTTQFPCSSVVCVSMVTLHRRRCWFPHNNVVGSDAQSIDSQWFHIVTAIVQWRFVFVLEIIISWRWSWWPGTTMMMRTNVLGVYEPSTRVCAYVRFINFGASIPPSQACFSFVYF